MWLDRILQNACFFLQIIAVVYYGLKTMVDAYKVKKNVGVERKLWLLYTGYKNTKHNMTH